MANLTKITRLLNFAKEHRSTEFTQRCMYTKDNWPAFPPSAIFLRSDNFLEPGPNYQYKPRLAQKDFSEEHEDIDLENKMLRDAVI